MMSAKYFQITNLVRFCPWLMRGIHNTDTRVQNEECGIHARIIKRMIIMFQKYLNRNNINREFRNAKMVETGVEHT